MLVRSLSPEPESVLGGRALESLDTPANEGLRLERDG
jgi:hypothetical protein